VPTVTTTAIPTTVTTTAIPTSPVRVTRVEAPQLHETTRVYSPTRITSSAYSPGRVVTSTRLSPGRTITEHAPRYVGSSGIATSTYIPAPTTTVTHHTSEVRHPVTTVYSPSRRISAITSSPSRVRIDNVGIH